MRRYEHHARTLNLVQGLHALLARLNDAPVTIPAADFLLTDREEVQQLTGTAESAMTDEQVLVSHGQDELRLALYIDSRVLDRLVRHDPFKRLDEQNLQDFCT